MMNLTTVDTVKIMLGIATTTYDAQITAFLPIVSSDVRKILNNEYNEKVDCIITSGSKTITDLYNINSLYNGLINENRFNYGLKGTYGLNNKIEVGRVIVSDSFPNDTYIESYDEENHEATVNNEATSDGTELNPTIMYGTVSTIAKMIWYKLKNLQNVEEQVTSKTMSVVSKSYAININKKWNYPQTLINDLGIPFARVN